MLVVNLVCGVALYALSLASGYFISGSISLESFHPYMYPSPSHPIYYLRPCFSLSVLVVTQNRGHIAGSSPPTVRALHFYSKNISVLSFLVDSRRIVLIHAI